MIEGLVNVTTPANGNVAKSVSPLMWCWAVQGCFRKIPAVNRVMSFELEFMHPVVVRSFTTCKSPEARYEESTHPNCRCAYRQSPEQDWKWVIGEKETGIDTFDEHKFSHWAIPYISMTEYTIDTAVHRKGITLVPAIHWRFLLNAPKGSQPTENGIVAILLNVARVDYTYGVSNIGTLSKMGLSTDALNRLMSYAIHYKNSNITNLIAKTNLVEIDTTRPLHPEKIHDPVPEELYSAIDQEVMIKYRKHISADGQYNGMSIGKFPNTESLVAFWCDLYRMNTWFIRTIDYHHMLTGCMNMSSRSDFFTSMNGAEQNRRGLSLLFRYPVNLESVHFYFKRSEAKNPNFAEEWYCMIENQLVAVSKTPKISHEFSKPMRTDVVTAEFAPKNVLNYFSRCWVLRLRGNFTPATWTWERFISIDIVLSKHF